jgi:superfamily II DNA or RNA helicase/HKD family nuclease
MSKDEMKKLNLPDGVYDLLITDEIRSAIDQAFKSEVLPVEDSLMTNALINHILPMIKRRLNEFSEVDSKISLANNLIKLLNEPHNLLEGAEKLQGLVWNQHSGLSKISKLPEYPLSELALITNNQNEPQIGSEIKAELQSADRVDILMSFVMNGGVNYLQNELQDFADRGGKIRLITTTYMGTSNADAIIRMARDFGAEVRISFKAQVDRLHAKSWIFYRESGFSSAYVGSSNLSSSAMFTGTEWNLKVSQATNSDIFARIQSNFEALWLNDLYQKFDPEIQENSLREALKAQRPDKSGISHPDFFRFIDVKPLQHQVDMLQDLEIERTVHNLHKNLIVSATGTGKTVLAALDYSRQIIPGQPRPKLLFVAHKREILNQALTTFRAILKDENFGEKFVDGERPTEWKYVFASIQSLNLKDKSDLQADHFDYVVIDEFHHAEAKSYKEFLNFIRPKELLALTATPERTDLLNVQDTFFGGRIASELRLWDAISEGLLAPFTYYGIADGTDLTGLGWSKGAYISNELEKIYTSNNFHINLVYNSLIKYLDNLSTSKILAFCASVDHAEYSANFLSKQGLKATAVTSRTSSEDRAKAISDLQRGDLNIICAVDIFNEGVDIPSIDTVLFLRPTESPLIFLQQLGRGLRRAQGKENLMVLDFVGAQNSKYRFDKKIQAMTRNSQLELARAVEMDQYKLPFGCQIVFDKKSKEHVLRNLKDQLKSKFDVLVEDLKSRGDMPLVEFMKINHLEFSDIFSKNKTWSIFREAAGFIPPLTDFERSISKRISNLVYAQDPIRNDYYRHLISNPSNRRNDSQFEAQVLESMLFWSIFDDGKNLDRVLFESHHSGIEWLSRNPALSSEMIQILDAAKERIDFLPERLKGELAALPLTTHAMYSQGELLAAFGYAQLETPSIWKSFEKRATKGMAAGVWYSPDLKTDLFFVTLNKVEKYFSTSVQYKDFAISKNLFHWESQNTTGPHTPTGARYINQSENGNQIVLAIRENKVDAMGSAPFQLVGQSIVDSYEGSNPMQFKLQTLRDLPSNLLKSSPTY